VSLRLFHIASSYVSGNIQSARGANLTFECIPALFLTLGVMLAYSRVRLQILTTLLRRYLDTRPAQHWNQTVLSSTLKRFQKTMRLQTNRAGIRVIPSSRYSAARSNASCLPALEKTSDSKFPARIPPLRVCVRFTLLDLHLKSTALLEHFLLAYCCRSCIGEARHSLATFQRGG
jgi:hypothetical protein